MTKYNQIFKPQIVSFYFEGHGNPPPTLCYFNLSNIVRGGIVQYKNSGIHSLAKLQSIIRMHTCQCLLAENGIQQSLEIT